MKLSRAVMTGAAILICASPALALDIHGNVVNGTTGDTSINTTVILVNPSRGMAQETEVQVVDGTFRLSNLDDQAPIYLLRVDYQGITYTETMRPGEDGHVTIRIYETTDNWNGLTLTVPHLLARRHDDHVQIERVYDVDNASTPPRTVTGESSYFTFTVPEEATIDELYVSTLGVPITRTATPLDTPGLYRLDYPLRPGLTRIGLSYTLPYDKETYSLHESLRYDIEEFSIYNLDADMLVTVTGAEFDMHDAAHGMTAFTARNLAKGTDLKIVFTGGSGQTTMTDPNGGEAAQGAVITVPNAMENVSIIMMVIVTLALVALFGMSSATPSPLSTPQRLQAHYEVLLRRLARLDDMGQAESIPNDVYRAKRRELKLQLATMLQRLRNIPTGASDPSEQTAESSRRQTN